MRARAADGPLPARAAVLAVAGNKLVVVDYFAEWCGPCKRIAPVLDALARKHAGKVVFVKVDVDASRDLAASRGVKSMPTLQFYRNSEQVDEMVGADPQALQALVAKATMPALLRHLTSSYALVVLAAGYLAMPWNRVLAGFA